MSLEKILLIAIETVIIVFITNKAFTFNVISYVTLFKKAIIVLLISSTITLLANKLFYKNEISEFKKIMMNTILKNKVEE